MRRSWRWAALCLLMWTGSVQAQPRMLCANDRQGRAICVAQTQIREETDGSRVARMHTGWAVVHPVNAFVRADCRGQLLEMLDYRGQPYAAAYFDQDAGAALLGEQMCAVRLR
jgi:hypothetical protein